MFRWTKDATRVEETREQKGIGGDAAAKVDYIRKQVMMKKLIEMTGADGTLSDGVFAEAMEALDWVIARRNAEKGVVAESPHCNTDNLGVRPTKCPPRPVRKGRPRNTSLKSYEAEVTKQAKHGPAGGCKRKESSTDEENPRGSKQRLWTSC